MYPIKSSVLMKNQKLSTERKQQGWTQARLAQALGVTTRTVIRWEQGHAMPQPNYRRRLGTLFGKTAQELGLLWDADEVPTVDAVDAVQAMPRSLARISRPDISAQEPLLTDPALPPTLGSVGKQLGRARLLMQVKERLLDAHLPSISLCGLPGIGKTSLAMALATDQEVRLQFRDGILWAPLGHQPHVLGQLTRWGMLLGVAPSDVENPQTAKAWGRSLRSTIGSRRMLLVIDDVWTVEDALALQIGGAQCTYLLTTHQPQVARALAQQGVVIVPQLEAADGLALLARSVPHLVQQDFQGAQYLVQAVDCLPLALTLMGTYLASPTSAAHPWPLQAALAQLHDTQKRLHLSMPRASEESWPGLAEMAPLSLYATIAICEQQLSPQAQAALHALAIFPPKPQSFSEEAALAVSLQSIETLDELCKVGLLEDWGTKRYSLHHTIINYARANTTTR